MRSIGIAAALLVAGCFGPTLPSEVSCSDGLCPEGLVCDQGFCREQRSEPDASLPAVDAAAADAAVSVCQTVTFRDGLDGYDATEDTEIRELQPDEDLSVEVELGWDSNGVDGFVVGLLRFNKIFGDAAGQVPLGSAIESATLTLVVVEPGSGPRGDLREVMIDWDDSTTWNTFGSDPGVDGDLAGNVDNLPRALGADQLDVTASIQRYSMGSPERGWAFVPDNDDGVDVRSSEAIEIDERPQLEVVFGCP